MSADQRPSRATPTNATDPTETTGSTGSTTPAGAADDRSQPTSGEDAASRAAIEIESRTHRSADETETGTAATTATASSSASAESALSHQIERTKLQAQVTALERALETSQSRQFEIVTQYERLLEERTDGVEDAARNESSSDDGAGETLLRRLLERWR